MYNFYFCRIHRAALWILGEYCETNEDIQNVMTMIRQALGEVRKGLIVCTKLVWICLYDIVACIGYIQ